MEEPDRDLATLLSRHKEAINALREGAKSVLGPEHDDIFLLRYVLSFSPADALEAMLPELAPALAACGLEVSGVRLRRSPPAAASRAPGQLLDSAR